MCPTPFPGAFSGDNSSYIAGRRLGVRVGGWVFRGRNGLRRREWGARTLATRGGYLIVVSRFVPGGRTATTFGAGLLEMRWRRFVVFAALAALLWASYAGLLGYLGGRLFEEQPWRGLLIALGLGFAITIAVEGTRRLRRRPG